MASETIPTITSADEATGLMRELSGSHEWVSVFWDKCWGDAPLEISVIVDGNGQSPKALLTPEVYAALRESGAVLPNSLQTYKARRVHNFAECAAAVAS